MHSSSPLFVCAPGMSNNRVEKDHARQQEALAEGKGGRHEAEPEGSRMSAKKRWWANS